MASETTIRMERSPCRTCGHMTWCAPAAGPALCKECYHNANNRRRAVLAEVARSCGVEMDDARLRYVVVQIDREMWDEMQAALKEAR